MGLTWVHPSQSPYLKEHYGDNPWLHLLPYRAQDCISYEDQTNPVAKDSKIEEVLNVSGA